MFGGILAQNQVEKLNANVNAGNLFFMFNRFENVSFSFTSLVYTNTPK